MNEDLVHLVEQFAEKFVPYSVIMHSNIRWKWLHCRRRYTYRLLFVKTRSIWNLKLPFCSSLQRPHEHSKFLCQSVDGSKRTTNNTHNTRTECVQLFSVSVYNVYYRVESAKRSMLRYCRAFYNFIFKKHKIFCGQTYDRDVKRLKLIAFEWLVVWMCLSQHKHNAYVT